MPCALPIRSEEHTSELQAPCNLVCRLLLEKKSTHPAGRRSNRRIPDPLQRPCPRAGGHALRPQQSGRRANRRIPDPFQRTFFFNDTATTEIYALSLHDALPI